MTFSGGGNGGTGGEAKTVNYTLSSSGSYEIVIGGAGAQTTGFEYTAVAADGSGSRGGLVGEPSPNGKDGGVGGSGIVIIRNAR